MGVNMGGRLKTWMPCWRTGDLVNVSSWRDFGDLILSFSKRFIGEETPILTSEEMSLLCVCRVLDFSGSILPGIKSY